MHTGDPALIELIRESIRARGPVSFAWFMEQALYHPRHGYYSSGRCAIGRAGDYFTSVSVGSLFGELLAAQFEEMWEALGRPADFTIVEQGAHQGEFAADALAAAHKNWPEFFSALRYRIIEPFSVLRKRQAETLSPFEGKVQWRDSLENLEPFVGVHFSNELLDALPVHLICSRCSRGPAASVIADRHETLWDERLVELRNDEFIFVERLIGDPALLGRLPRLPSRPTGYVTEVNLAALELIEAISRRLERGFVLAVDYGYPCEEYYATPRTNGTLQCRAEHRILRSPFEEIGCADVTAHVEWTSVAERAVDCGLALAGFTDQHHFITGVIAGRMRDDLGENADPKKRRTLQTLLHPDFLGVSFQYLALARNIAPEVQLSGFRFARDPRLALGLSPFEESLTALRNATIPDQT
jgi:SAM-dependent MidA family methyltransferase